MKQLLTVTQADRIIRSWGYSSMTDLQKTALNSCVYGNGAREFIIGDTSSGKTLVPAVAFQAYRQAYGKGKLLYILPYRALAAQKQVELKRIFPNLDIKLSTSEFCASDASISTGNCDIAIIIYEKAFLFQIRKSSFLRYYSHIVFDEIGIVEQTERGFKADYLLNHACRNPGSNLYLLATPYYDWKPYITCYGFQERRESSRPVTVESKAVVLSTKERGDARQYKKELEQERLQEITNLCRKHLDSGHKILIFANSKLYVRQLAHYLNKVLYGTEWKKEFSISEGRRRLFSGLYMSEADIMGVLGENEDITAYYNGITFHNATLPEGIREKIENDFLDGDGILNIVCATETLAFGLNSNVDTVIITQMTKSDAGEVRNLTINEYRNYIGRAGRLGVRKKGYGYAICKNEQEYEYWKSVDALSGRVEALHNSFTEDRLSAENIMMLLHFYDGQKILSNAQLVGQICTFPVTADRSVLRQMVEMASEYLEERKLIRRAFDEITLEDGFKITDQGRNILGYIIDIRTYDKLVQCSRQLFSRDMPLFDFLHEISDCPEVSVITGARISDCAEKRGKIISFLGKLQKEGNISPRLYARITSARSLSFFKKSNLTNGRFRSRPELEDWQYFYQILFLAALYSWMNAADLNWIYNFTGVDYQRIQNKSTKIKYIIDTMLSAFNRDITQSEYARMERIGASCYYGVRLDVLTDMMQRKIFNAVNEIEPVDGRQLRMISQVLNYYEAMPDASRGKLQNKIWRCRKVKAPYFAYLKEKCNYKG